MSPHASVRGTLCHAARRLRHASVTSRCSSTSGRASAAPPPPPVPCFWADWAEVPLPEGHRFPMDKYRTVRLQLESDPALAGRLELQRSPLAALEDVTRVHCPTYVDAVLHGKLTASEQRAVGFPWSREHVQRSLASTGGTVAATRLVLASGGKLRCAMQVAGGTHHAHRDKGGGFCVFNDLACAASAALADGSVSRVLIIDLDVHRGDGSAAIFAGDPRVTTYSMHGYNNYGNRSGVPSDYDVDFPDGTGDEECAFSRFASRQPPRPDSLPTLPTQTSNHWAPGCRGCLTRTTPSWCCSKPAWTRSRGTPSAGWPCRGRAWRPETTRCSPPACRLACRWSSPWAAATQGPSTRAWRRTQMCSGPRRCGSLCREMQMQHQVVHRA